MKKVGFIVFEDFAIWQVALLQKFLNNNGYEIETLSIGGGLVRTDGGLYVASEALEGRDANEFEMLLLPGAGGAMPESLLENKELHLFLQTFKGLIAASCASTIIIASAGIFDGEYTTMPHMKDRFSSYFPEDGYCDCDVVSSEKIISARGYAHYDFMMAVLGRLGILEADPRLGRMALKLSKNQ
ncbi:DJ-1/PfpI family protein [Neobacillus sp. YIM B06451]|uniref:DJ-1/PfpI family protein n=1 Tax=Neobacillus sp. YIM B06451 TaxID=3070994 RepID=UPI00292E2FBC|nr:DJ-1/PfpI family protein [Neobacillus sp. YIM B06451]